MLFCVCGCKNKSTSEQHVSDYLENCFINKLGWQKIDNNTYLEIDPVDTSNDSDTAIKESTTIYNLKDHITINEMNSDSSSFVRTYDYFTKNYTEERTTMYKGRKNVTVMYYDDTFHCTGNCDSLYEQIFLTDRDFADSNISYAEIMCEVNREDWYK